jgi:hypothetical protein
MSVSFIFCGDKLFDLSLKPVGSASLLYEKTCLARNILKNLYMCTCPG